LDFRDSPDDVAFRSELRSWLATNAPAGLERIIGGGAPTRERLEALRAWQRTMSDGGWAAISWPTEWGGRDATPAQVAIFNEEIALANLPNTINSIGIWNIGPMILAVGTHEQKRRWLPSMLSGDEIWCQGFSETEAGSDLAALATRAETTDDGFVVTGHKIWTTYADFADRCLALVRTDPGARKHEGISALVIDMHAPGVEVRPITEITGDATFNEIFFTDVQVPRENLVGELHRGWDAAMRTLANERLGTMTLGIQLAQAMEDLLALARMVKREAKPAIEDPVIRDRLASLHADVASVRLLAIKAMTKVQRGEPTTVEVALGKIQWSIATQRIAELAVELQGAAGLLGRDAERALDHGRWQHAMVHSRMTTIGAGTTEIQKNILAQRGLGLPRAT
jgi:alkylation response protein AidB-like acyl-CoA dehydrogenase